MKRITVLLYCAICLVSVTGTAHADRQVYDAPSAPRPVVGDDDEPLVTTAVPDAVRRPEAVIPRQKSANSIGTVLAWIRDTTRRARTFAHARAFGIWPAGPLYGSDT